MSRIRGLRGTAWSCIVGYLLTLFFFGPVLIAHASGFVNVHTYAVQATNNTGGPVNDAQIRVRARKGNDSLFAPNCTYRYTTSSWPFNGTPAEGAFRVVKFGPGVWLSNGNSRWFVASFTISGRSRTYSFKKKTLGFFSWTVNNTLTGALVPLGSVTGSPPALANDDLLPEGTTNTIDMVVSDLRFAKSPALIPVDQLTLDNPGVVALFEASLDPTRTGPIIVPPGHESTEPIGGIPIDPSITDPEVNGSTVLLRAVVQDANGSPVPFLIQFSAEPEQATGFNTALVAFFAVLSIITGSFVVISLHQQ